MKIQNTFIKFEEKGERITGKKGKIKTNRNSKLFFELNDVPGEESPLRININDYLANRINQIKSDYVTIVCKDVERNFVDVWETEMPDWAFKDVLIDDSLEFNDGFSYCCEDVICSLADVIRLNRSILYRDETVDSLLEQLQDYLEEVAGV